MRESSAFINYSRYDCIYKFYLKLNECIVHGNVRGDSCTKNVLIYLFFKLFYHVLPDKDLYSPTLLRDILNEVCCEEGTLLHLSTKVCFSILPRSQYLTPFWWLHGLPCWTFFFIFQSLKTEIVKSIWTTILWSSFYRWEMWIWLGHCYLQTLTLEFIMKLVCVGTFN